MENITGSCIEGHAEDRVERLRQLVFDWFGDCEVWFVGEPMDTIVSSKATMLRCFETLLIDPDSRTLAVRLRPDAVEAGLNEYGADLLLYDDPPPNGHVWLICYASEQCELHDVVEVERSAPEADFRREHPHCVSLL